jgi:hypothetical protein
MQTDYLILTIINIVKSTGNDAELGAKIRAIINPIIQAQGLQEGKNILKG